MKIYLIRHGKTKGNQERRYVGRTDESVLKSEINEMRKMRAPIVDAIYVSPMKRCRETANAIWPESSTCEKVGFKECDFGAFEYKNYTELKDHPAYQAWMDSEGMIGFPGGESREVFQDRCVKAFDEVITNALINKYEGIALIVHGGTIMSILDRYAKPHFSFYHWQVNTGKGFFAKLHQSEQHDTYWLEEIVPYE